MVRTWTEIVADIAEIRISIGNQQFTSALAGIEAVASSIANAPAHHGLHGWTAMHDLCIQQADVAPYSASYLRLSPQSSGLVEFRYFDTMIDQKQWNRTVPPEQAMERFSTFLDQLHWISKRG